MMSRIRILVGFAVAADLDLLEQAGVVERGLYGNPAFPDPPLTEESYAAAVEAYRLALVRQPDRGLRGTAEKHEERAVLVEQMRVLASYVEKACRGSEAAALSSGFRIANPSRARRVLEAPVIKKIRRRSEGVLHLEVTAIRNARGFELEMAEEDDAPGPWRSLGIQTNSRALTVEGLTLGMRYRFRVRAVGGATGYSDWSEPMSQIAF